MPELTGVPGARGPALRRMEIGKFRGVDLTSGKFNCEPNRSPEAPNMLPDADGFPVKRKGFTLRWRLQGAVHGAYTLRTSQLQHTLVHAGSRLYRDGQVVYEGMADAPSCAVQLNDKLWILDGQTYLYYDGQTVAPVSSIATVPVVTIAKAPNKSGAATSYKPVNLLTGKRTDSFAGTASTTDYYLSFTDLTDTPVTAQVLGAEGEWADKVEGGDFTVDRALGKVSWKTAPGVSPVTGEDNVRITYETQSGAQAVNQCRVSILYGVNGALDRVFLSGNPSEPNVDRWSEYNDPTYIGDTFYGVLGQEGSPIVGYSVLSNTLVTHKRGEENDRNAFVRGGTLDSEGYAVFAITNVVQGDGAVSSRGFGSLSSEPVFFTDRGVYALTPSDITGERYTQNRSWFLDGELARQPGKQNACACVWGQFYCLALNGRLYLLDSNQKSDGGKSPYSSYQYEGYYFTGVDATALWVQDGGLWYGRADGAVLQYNSGASTDDYADDGEAYEAYWTTPLMNLGFWGNKKTVKGVWVVAQPYTRSSGQIYYATDREEERLVREYTVDIFDMDDIDFGRFTFNTLDRPSVVNAGKKEKKCVLFQLKVRNAAKEPFGIYAMYLTFVVGGKVKKR